MKDRIFRSIILNVLGILLALAVIGLLGLKAFAQIVVTPTTTVQARMATPVSTVDVRQLLYDDAHMKVFALYSPTPDVAQDVQAAKTHGIDGFAVRGNAVVKGFTFVSYYTPARTTAQTIRQLKHLPVNAPGYLHAEGRPVVFLTSMGHEIDWLKITQSVNESFYFLNGCCTLKGDTAKQWINSATPIRIRHDQGTDIPYVVIDSWNHYDDHTAVEQGVENHLTLNTWLSSDARTLRWDIGSAEPLTVDHFTVYVSTDGTNLMPLVNLSHNVRELNLGGRYFLPRTYYLYVEAVGVPFITNRMSGRVTYMPRQ